MKKFLTLLVIGLVCGLLAIPAGGALAAADLVVAVDSPPRTMDPGGSLADPNLSVMGNIFDPLMSLEGPEGELSPALAESFEHPDLLTWKFNLRKGVKFTNGNDFNAADVKFTMDRLSDPKCCSEFLDFGKSLASVEVVDDYTVVIKTKSPVPYFPTRLNNVSILDKESSEGRDVGDMGLHPIGTGAYKVVEWVKGSYLKLTANENYWRGAPAIKNVELQPITEASTRFAALVSGKVDLMSGVPVELFDKVAQNPKIEIFSRPARRTIFLMLGNKEGTPTADLRVRQAMYMAINEDEIIQKLMRGHASPAAQLADSAMVGFNDKIMRPAYDPEKAMQLLKDAGHADGFEITLAGPNDRYVQDEKIAEAVVKYLAKVGIKAKLDVKPKAAYFPEVVGAKHNFCLLGWLDSTYDYGRTFSDIIHTHNPDTGAGTWNGVRFSSPELDKMLDAANQIADPDKRRAALEELNAKSMDQVAIIPLHYGVNLYAAQKAKKVNFVPRPDRWLLFREISFK